MNNLEMARNMSDHMSVYKMHPERDVIILDVIAFSVLHYAVLRYLDQNRGKDHPDNLAEIQQIKDLLEGK